MKNLAVAISGILIWLISGCATVSMAPLDNDTKAKEFSPAENKASLYIYRNENLGAAIPMAVSMNGKALGQTAAKTFFWFNLTPGKYNIESHAENVSSLSLTLEGGKNYFVWQEVKMGAWMARSLLQQTPDPVGRAGVMESKLIASSISENDLSPMDSRNATSPPPPSSSAITAQKLRELQGLRSEGIISEEEFQKKRAQLLENF